MNDTNFNNFIRKLKSVALTERERGSMRERLLAYTEMHPMPEPAAVPSPFWGSFMLTRAGSAVAVVLALTVTSSSIIFASEESVPGDALYNLKVSVTEEAIDRLAVTEEAKAKWRAERAERRLSEAVQLAAEDRLESNVSAYLAHEFDEHADAASAIAAKLEQEGDHDAALEIETELESRLDAHSTLLAIAAEFEREMDGNDEEVRILASAVAEHADEEPIVEEEPEAVIAIAVEPPAATTMMASEAADAPIADDAGDTARVLTLSIAAEPEDTGVMLKQAAVNDDTSSVEVQVEIAPKKEPAEVSVAVSPEDPTELIIRAKSQERVVERIEDLIRDRGVAEGFKIKLQAWREMNER